MIVDVLANSERIEGLNPYFKVVFDYIKTHDFQVCPWDELTLTGIMPISKLKMPKDGKPRKPCMNGMISISIFKCL